MTIIVFLVDTSASMNQRTHMGTTFLDTAKHTIEMFLKIRSRDPVCRLDRYMLLTFEDPPMNVKAGWKESHCTFMKELKSLEANGLSNLGSALKNTFDMLNVNRLQTGIDTFGQGRFPFYIEPAIIICLTDGNKMTSKSGATNELNLPMNAATALLGSELTKEPFRWDQRLYSIVYKIGPTSLELPEALSYVPTAEDTPIDAMCEVTGGRSYAITTQKSLVQCLESLAQKLQSGVIVNFEKLPSDCPNGADEPHQDFQPWHNCRRLLFVNRSAQRGGTTGHWPIPECYWPDAGKEALPPRCAHPPISFSCRPCEPITVDNIPFDKYELEPSPLTHYILERRQPNVAWQVFMKSSSKYSELGHPFGYLKASTNLTSVNLFVMPYNYPLLFSLLDELIKVHKYKITPKWRMQFEGYLKSVPPYYATPLKKAFGRLPMLPNLNLIPDQMENCFSYSVVSYLKKIKNQARIVFEHLVASVGQCPPPLPAIRVVTRTPRNSTLDRAEAEKLMAHYAGDIYGLKKELALSLDNYETFTLHADPKTVDAHIYTNPFDINRKDLILNLSRLRLNFLSTTQDRRKLQHTDVLHSMPIQEMGNYQEYLKKQPPPLREIETTPTRIHTFGNPFKVKQNLMIDEADEAMLSPASSTSARKRSSSESSTSSSLSSPVPISSPRPFKRKQGPLPRNVPSKFFLSPSPSPSGSPVPSPLYSEPLGSPGVLPGESENSCTSATGHNPLMSELLVNHSGTKRGPNCNNRMVNGTPDIPPTNHVDASEGPLVNGSREGSTNNVTACKVSRQDTEADVEHNNNIKKIALKEVRKPGRNFSSLLDLLKSLKGSLQLKKLVLDRIALEAVRFKRTFMIEAIQDLELGS